MIHYNALTPKPHYAYSNSSRISQLDMGKLVRKTVDQDANLKTCETYVDSEGNKRFKGTKRLRQTELLMEYPVRFGFKLVDMFDDLTKTNRGQVALSQSNPVPPAIQSFQLMKEHTCGMEFARLEEVFNYLRRCKHLKIPHEWKCLIPKPFP
ncbi:unnamed protein product [Durusdinium trenchii]|uniref:Uncharacterized protein n=1 Tax=Durusdinium trenchii TaxID=1381693 RepID=A0ABP0MDF9_9DINO